MAIRGSQRDAFHMGSPDVITHRETPLGSTRLGLPDVLALSRPRWVRLSWLVFLGVGLGTALGSGLIANEEVVQPFLNTLGLSATAAILIGVRLNRPPRSLPWWLIALCTLCTTLGIGILPRVGDPGGVAPGLAAIGYTAGFSGFVILMRGRIPGGERGAFLDAAILAAGIGVLIWAFGFAPLLLETRGSTAAAAAFFYPALVASAVVARMWFIGGAHRPATRLLVGLVMATLAITSLDVLRGLIGTDIFPGMYLFVQFASLAFVGAAALHPSMALAPERHQVEHEHVSRSRIVALTTALLVNPATLAIQASGGRHVDPAPYLIGGVLIGLLVIARLGDALRQLGDSLRERESLMDRLRHQALHDALTSLPNRSLFAERLSADVAGRSHDRLLAVLLVDLDNFKAVNDSYGHEAGDGLLVAVGERLRTAIRDGDTVARLGGDEFVISLPDCADRQVAIRVAQRILATLGEPFDIGGHNLSVHASVGVAVAGDGAETADDLIRDADVAMYSAKSRGKGRFEVFEPSMQVAALTQLQLRADLANAIAEKDLRLHYQPVIDLRTGRTVGFEALVRWLRDGRLVGPGEFIPIAEASGLIGPLTDWVVDEACRTAAGWEESGDQWMSVNLSSSQLIRQDMVGRIARTLAETGMTPDRFVIEITESSLLEIEVARPAIERLSELGVRVAIDDFGTGYSALSYLARLQIDIVKIDRSFVVALGECGPEAAIAAAIITLAKQLGLTTIGEGIETDAQLDQLAALGCDLGQGFLLGRPAATEDLRRKPIEPRLRPRLVSVDSLIA
jgi:diguanylate cyclase (GGDEF)-like protein